MNLKNKILASLISAIDLSYSTTISFLIVNYIEVYSKERGANILINL